MSEREVCVCVSGQTDRHLGGESPPRFHVDQCISGQCIYLLTRLVLTRPSYLSSLPPSFIHSLTHSLLTILSSLSSLVSLSSLIPPRSQQHIIYTSQTTFTSHQIKSQIQFNSNPPHSQQLNKKIHLSNPITPEPPLSLPPSHSSIHHAHLMLHPTVSTHHSSNNRTKEHTPHDPHAHPPPAHVPAQQLVHEQPPMFVYYR